MAHKKSPRRSIAPSFQRFEVEGAADTLMRAEEIKVNKPLMTKVAREVKKRQKALQKITKK